MNKTQKGESVMGWVVRKDFGGLGTELRPHEVDVAA